MRDTHAGCAPDEPTTPGSTPIELAHERLQAYNEVLIAQTEMLLEQQAHIRATCDELARFNAAKDEILQLVSHELRTPLAVAKNSLSILARGLPGALNPEQERFVAMGLGALDDLRRILDEILNWQKLEAGRALCELAADDVGEPLRQELAEIAPALEAKAIGLDVSLGSEPLRARIDRRKFGQALRALLSNAEKFTPPGGRVMVAAQAAAGEIRVAITNTGAGIPSAQRARVFEAFVQLGDGLTRSVGGSGLGLTICKRIVEDGHGGRIAIEGPEDGEVTVAIALPGLDEA
jgi:signal transduction histidine kinase